MHTISTLQKKHRTIAANKLLFALKTKPYFFILLGLLSGLLNWAAWPGSPLTGLIFIGFIPLLVASERAQHTRIFFLSCYMAMLVWNIGTTWWIWNATVSQQPADVYSLDAVLDHQKTSLTCCRLSTADHRVDGI